jgi:hypothetical protein
MAFEPSNEKWKITLSNRDKKRIVTIDARNLERLGIKSLFQRAAVNVSHQFHKTAAITLTS